MPCSMSIYCVDAEILQVTLVKLDAVISPSQLSTHRTEIIVGIRNQKYYPHVLPLSQLLLEIAKFCFLNQHSERRMFGDVPGRRATSRFPLPDSARNKPENRQNTFKGIAAFHQCGINKVESKVFDVFLKALFEFTTTQICARQ